MFSSSTQIVITFAIICTLLIATLIAFIALIVYRYQQKQNAYYKGIEELKSIHANEILQSQLEIQEQTFENISREIHDNIGQKLTLAKLHLNTLNIGNVDRASIQLNDSILIIGEAINDLSDISRSMSSEIIMNNGLIKALEFEVAQLNKSRLFKIELIITGESIFLNSQKELILFRIIQEALNNIIKHAFADRISIHIHYNDKLMTLNIHDNGKGFIDQQMEEKGIGISNMKKRANMLKGVFNIKSEPGTGTNIIIQIPLYEN